MDTIQITLIGIIFSVTIALILLKNYRYLLGLTLIITGLIMTTIMIPQTITNTTITDKTTGNLISDYNMVVTTSTNQETVVTYPMGIILILIGLIVTFKDIAERTTNMK